jgi:hypothetical protein
MKKADAKDKKESKSIWSAHLKIVKVEVCGSHVVVESCQHIGRKLCINLLIQPQAGRDNIYAPQIHDPPHVWLLPKPGICLNDLLHASNPNRKHKSVRLKTRGIARLDISADAGLLQSFV